MNSTMYTNTYNDVPTACDMYVLTTFLIGALVGMGAILGNKCCTKLVDDHDRLADEIDELTDIIEDLNVTNDGLELENGRLVADTSANERLISNLKLEIINLQNKITRMDTVLDKLEADNRSYAVEVNELHNSVMRSRNLNTNHLSVIRKRIREEEL